jgi:hypothetical protein
MCGSVQQLESGTIAESTVDEPARSGYSNYVFRALGAAQELEISSWLAMLDSSARL